MDDLKYMGADGGRLAIAFASGCIACFTFLSIVGGFIWKVVGNARIYRIAELETALKDEREHCRAMEVRLVERIQALETIVLYSRTGQGSIAEVNRDVRELSRRASDE